MTNQLPVGLKLSKAQRDRLPDSEKDKAIENLWEKSNGLCALCDLPLPMDATQIQADHRIAEKQGSGGPTELANLYLAHKHCNLSRQNLPFELGSKICRYNAWAKGLKYVSYNDVVGRFVPNGTQRIKYSVGESEATLSFAGASAAFPVFIDPATKTKYFFAEIPIEYINNDNESQPRSIEADHVRDLVVDFDRHPVHEPSNCRLVPRTDSVAELLQFDGQHKTTAQIILGRTAVQMKIYVDPDEVMIQRLVLQIQQGIKKRPLTTSDTLRKLDQVLKERLDRYAAPAGRPRSEKGFVDSLPLEERKTVKKQLISNIESVILFHEDNKLHQYASTSPDKKFPMTDKVMLAKLIRPFICGELLDTDMENPAGYERDHEREAVVLIHNEIVANMLEGRWGVEASVIDQTRARNFFYQGALGWSIGSILIPSLTLLLKVNETDKVKMFTKKLDDHQIDMIKRAVKELCALSIWSTSDPEALAALRSNTVSRVAKNFPGIGNIDIFYKVMGLK